MLLANPSDRFIEISVLLETADRMRPPYARFHDPPHLPSAHRLRSFLGRLLETVWVVFQPVQRSVQLISLRYSERLFTSFQRVAHIEQFTDKVIVEFERFERHRLWLNAVGHQLLARLRTFGSQERQIQHQWYVQRTVDLPCRAAVRGELLHLHHQIVRVGLKPVLSLRLSSVVRLRTHEIVDDLFACELLQTVGQLHSWHLVRMALHSDLIGSLVQLYRQRKDVVGAVRIVDLVRLHARCFLFGLELEADA